MQKRRSYWTVSSLCVLAVLSACGEEEDGTTNTATGGNEGEQSQESNTPVEEDGYSEYAEIAVDGYVSDPVFYISGNGETVLWAEQPGELTQIEGSKVWVDGETKEADIPERDPAIQPMLSESGMIVYSHSDRDRPVEERNWVGELNPSTGERTEFYMGNDWDEYVVTMGSNYTEDPRRVINIRNHYDEEVVHMYIWDMDANEIKELDVTETVANEVELEELTLYPHGAITNDGTELYATLADVGIFRYDLENDTSEFIYSADLGFFSNNEKSQTSILTTDDRYILYAMLDERRMTHFAYEIETGESIELGEGIATYPLEDGSVMMFTYEDEFIHFDLDGDTSVVAHTPDLGEDDRIDSFTVSKDGSTLAYVVRDENNESVIRLQRR
ncbi:hypothetical protein JOC54_003143 [Alkalihalobacillus xiaoxiensis]|uniref:Uncharacterized protein n=1 Tax=Shouchella xiaoxiensis TaxID=766895 RepID=A0ABS2SWI6_9BACI|nr:hypothetical protein [Shouchella xiaoxiensis]MBM7839863.1 hypothetical protein [Shouchella xiaoxiensis]